MTTMDVLGGPTALDPEAVRETPPTVRPVRHGGLTLPVLAFAALVASPAIWQCLVRHALPMHVMLERYVLIAVGCLAVSEVVRRMLPHTSSEPDARASGDAGIDDGIDDGDDGGPPPADTLVVPAVADESSAPAPADPALSLLAAEA